MAVEVCRRRATEGETDLVFQRGVEHTEHQIGATEHREVDVQVGLGLQLWLPGLALWLVGHSLAVWGARLDPQFLQVFARHIKQPSLLDV